MISSKIKVVKPERPGGFLDFLPADYLAREKMLRTIEKVFRSFGFDPIETPRVEFLKTLSGEESETGKNLFTISSANSNGQNEKLALAFDHTVPFARFLASNPYNAKKRTGIRLPWKRMVVGPVFRAETPQSGRYRQFYQFDADIAGTSSMLADAEIIALMYKTLKALGVSNFLIRINNRKILNGLAELVGITERENVSKDDITMEMMRILDKLDKIGLDDVIAQLKETPVNEFSPLPALSDDVIGKVVSYLRIKGDNESILSQCREIFKGVKIAEEGIKELEEILQNLGSMEVLDDRLKVDISIARGLDYYTGPVMETVLRDAPEFGSIFSGGRFNDLVARFTGQELPAVGASIGVDRLFAALDSLRLVDKSKKAVSEVLVLRLSNSRDHEYINIVNQIRATGVNAELSFLEDTTFKNQFNYGLNRNIKYLAICGEDEFAEGNIKFRNLETREQTEISLWEIGSFFHIKEKIT